MSEPVRDAFLSLETPVRVFVTCRTGTMRLNENPCRWESEYHTIRWCDMTLAEYLEFQEQQLKTNFREVRKISFEEIA